MKQCLTIKINADDFCQIPHKIYRLNISTHLTSIPLESITGITVFCIQNLTAHVIGALHIKSLEIPYRCLTRTLTTYRTTSNSSQKAQRNLFYVVLAFLPILPKPLKTMTNTTPFHKGFFVTKLRSLWAKNTAAAIPAKMPPTPA